LVMEEAAPLSPEDQKTIATIATRLQALLFMSHHQKAVICCELVAQVRAGATPKDLYSYYDYIPRHVIYKVISRARKAGVLSPFKPVLQRKARSQVTQLGLGSMYVFAQTCGDDLLYWIVKNKPEGSTQCCGVYGRCSKRASSRASSQLNTACTIEPLVRGTHTIHTLTPHIT
jgi:hypothetical protein